MNSHCETVQIHQLDTLPVDQMWALFDQNYEGVSRQVFEQDLLQKQQALLLWRAGRLAGFTSQGFATIQGHRVTYSGDVVIAPKARDIGSANFFHHWACAVWKKFDWWLSLTAGPRTFRIAHTFYRRVTPSANCEETEGETTLRHTFARRIYGKAYCPETGIVKLDHAYTQTKGTSDTRAGYPLERYFETVNPGWKQGDELVSLISLHPENWKPAALRMLKWQPPHA